MEPDTIVPAAVPSSDPRSEFRVWYRRACAPGKEANVMRMRLGAPLAMAVVGLLWAASNSQAAHCGSTGFGVLKRPASDAQCCFSSSQQQTRTCYKLVWDTVTEKRFHTCHQTVCE